MTPTDEVRTHVSRKAREQAIHIVENPDSYIFIDFETTGLNGYIVQVGLFARGLEYQVAVNPLVPIEEQASAINGFTDDYVVDLDPLIEHIEYIGNICAHRTLIAYNAPFERKILSNEIDREGWESSMGVVHGLLTQPWLDLAVLYAEWVGTYKENGTLKYWKLNGDHSALGDCVAMRDLVRYIAVMNTPSLYTPGAQS